MLPNFHIERWRGWWRLLNRWLWNYRTLLTRDRKGILTFVSMTPVDSGRLRVFDRGEKSKNRHRLYTVVVLQCAESSDIFTVTKQHLIMFSLEGWKGTLGRTISHFLHWKRTLESTMSGFLHWRGTLDGTMSHSLHWKGTIEEALFDFFHWEGGRAP